MPQVALLRRPLGGTWGKDHSAVSRSARQRDRRWQPEYETVGGEFYEGSVQFAPPTVVDGTRFAAGSVTAHSIRAKGGLNTSRRPSQP